TVVLVLATLVALTGCSATNEPNDASAGRRTATPAPSPTPTLPAPASQAPDGATIEVAEAGVSNYPDPDGGRPRASDGAVLRNRSSTQVAVKTLVTIHLLDSSGRPIDGLLEDLPAHAVGVILPGQTMAFTDLTPVDRLGAARLTVAITTSIWLPAGSMFTFPYGRMALASFQTSRVDVQRSASNRLEIFCRVH